MYLSGYEESYAAVPDDPHSAKLSKRQAVPMVHKYIQSIPVDRYTELTPAWVPENTKEGIVITCHMPHKTPLRGHPVRGPPRSNCKTAKRETAFMIIKQLHKLGELDDQLKIKKRIRQCENVEEDVDAYNRRAGTKKRRRFYLKEDLPELSCLPEGPFHLHAIHLELVEPLKGSRYRIHFPEKDISSLGLLTSTPLPCVGPFLLPHSPSGKVEVTIEYLRELKLEDKEQMACTNFHQHIFSHVLSLTDRMDFCGGGPLVVPLLEGSQLDTKTLESFKSTSTSLDLSQMDQLVVFPAYKPTNDNNRHFFIEGVEENLGVNDSMPNGAETFVAYYKRKYNLEVGHMGPLLHVSSASKTPNMLQPGGQKMRTGRKEGLRSFFLPQLMGVEGVGAGLWRQAQMLPSILHRLSSILAVKDLLMQLGSMPPSPRELHIPQSYRTRQTFESLIDPRRDIGWPEPWCILEAVTLAKAEDIMNMENLEVLGDAFLKFSSSIFLYYKSLEDREEEYHHKDEGEMTMERSSIVSNRHLYNLAIKLGLQQVVVERKLEPSISWQPPGFSREALDDVLKNMDSRFPTLVDVVNSRNLGGGSLLNWLRYEDLDLIHNSDEEDHTEEEILLNRAVERLNQKEASELSLRSYKLVSDKSLADCMEALIGAFLVHSGQKLTFR